MSSLCNMSSLAFTLFEDPSVDARFSFICVGGCTHLGCVIGGFGVIRCLYDKICTLLLLSPLGPDITL